MSNTIWKTPDQEQEHNEEVLIEYIGVSGRPFYEFDDFVRRLPNLKRWCYITDLIAQADKAELLEKEKEAMRQEFEVWHGNYECEVEEKKQLQKAVDKALDTLDYVSNEKFATGDGDFFEEYEQMHKAIKQGIDEIKQLIKGGD